MKWEALFLAALLALSSQQALAKRLGGGSSFGKQSSNVTQRSAPAPAVAPATTPTNVAASKNTATSPQTATPAPTPARRPWAGMLGGLAAGLGLAWLASSLGLGEGFAQVLTVLLLGGVLLAVVGWFLRSRTATRAPTLAGAYAGSAGADTSATALRSYSPQNVGNDASARPWERGQSTFGTEPEAASHIGSALVGSQSWGVPADFDTAGFLAASKANFIRLQAAWDKGDIPALRVLMTDDMLGQIQTQLAEHEAEVAVASNQTEVVMLEAQLLGIEDLGTEYMASVEFSGMIREEPAAGPNPFREVWNITRPKTGTGGWLVAGVQALQ